jgi:hypothetical protein
MVIQLIKSASISKCGCYRWSLSRSWGQGPCLLFVMLNPSTADNEQDDPTLRRCINFSKREGFSRLELLNLFPLRSPHPSRLLESAERSRGGRYAEDTLRLGAQRADKIICAWGSFSIAAQRFEELMSIFDEYDLFCLGKTRTGQPRHPLYLKSDATLELWRPARTA